MSNLRVSGTFGLHVSAFADDLEGQGFIEYPDRKMYGKMASTLLAGGGFRFMPSPSLYIRMEMLGRYTGTDYLDDVSQRAYIDPTLFYNYFVALKEI